MEYVTYAIVAILAYWIGGHVRAFQIMQNLIKRPDEMIELINRLKEINNAESSESDAPADAIPLEIEEVKGQFYAYDKITGEFLAQAPNKYLVGLAAAARYPNKKFWHPDFKEDSQTA